MKNSLSVTLSRQIQKFSGNYLLSDLLYNEFTSCCPTADCGYVFLYEKGDPNDFKYVNLCLLLLTIILAV